jgi:RNA polymerase sigma-70 factor (ECF subfamily)
LFDEVVEKAVHGGPAEVNQLFELVQPAIVSFCRTRIGGNAAFGDAEDVAQEACVSLLAALPKFDRAVSGFLAFAYGIASHKVVDHFRRCGRDRTVTSAELIDSVDSADGPDVQSELFDQSRRIAVLLRQLNERQRDVLAMRVVVGMTSAETAAVMGMTPVAVRVTQRRALILLRAAVADAQTKGE